ncbi:hypothetical protein BH09BAC1_BH09BAC1_26160 [soil metagenome]
MRQYLNHIILTALMLLSGQVLLWGQVVPLPITHDSSFCSKTRMPIILRAKPASTTQNERIAWYTNGTTATRFAVTDSNLQVFGDTTVTYYAQTVVPGLTTTYDSFMYERGTLNIDAQYYTYYLDGEKFNVYEPIVLKSVVMEFQNMYNVVVVIKDSLGNVVFTKTLAVPSPPGELNGRQEVILDANLTPGLGYTITAEGSAGGGMLRNFQGVTYPYTATDPVTGPLLTVTGTINALPNYLYFFYDWKVQKISNEDTSARVPVTAYVNTQPILGFFGKKICPGDTLTLDATQNATGATYLWSTGATTPQIKVFARRDKYSVTVSIPAGGGVCVRSDTVQIDTFARTFMTIIDTSYSSCAGDVVDDIAIKLTGGELPFQGYWANENNPTVIIDSFTDTNNSIQILDQVPYGSYTLTVRDFRNCISVFDSITITEPAPLSIQINYLDSIICNGEPTGKLEAILSGGRAPYLYDWYTISGTPLATGRTLPIDTLSDLPADTYVLSLKDTNNCELKDTVDMNFVIGTVPLNYDTDRNTSFGANSELWSAFVIYDANKLTPYYDNYFIEYVSAFISDEDTNIVEAILRVRKDVADEQRPFIAGSHWTKIYEDNVTADFRGINGFKCVKLNGAAVILESGRKYIIEIEFLMKDGSVQVLGVDAGTQANPNGAWLFNLANPNGVPLSSLGAFNRNWNIRLTLRDIAYVGEQELAVASFNSLHSFPNPATDQVHFAFQLPRAGHVSLKVYDLQGREVVSLINEQLIAKDSQFITWDIEKIPVGTYIGVLQTEDCLFTTKLLIVR